MNTSTISRPIPVFALYEQAARKWRMGRRLYRAEGALPLLVEILCQVCKPLVWTYDSCRWLWFRARGHKSFTVMGNEIAVFPKDPGISRELALYRVHEPLATKLLKETLQPGMNAIDVGGNIGYYAMMEARLVGPTGKVVAIEPMPDNSEQLCFNVAKNGYDNIDIHKMAIGDHDGTAVMYITARSNWHSLHPPAEAKSEMKVRVSSLDSLVLPYNLPSVDLIRMDLEGYEIVVIEGMKKVLEKYGPRLLVELHPLLVGTPAMEKYLRTLEGLGYGIEWMIEQERDMPLRWHFLKIERPSIRQLMNDPRMWEDPRALTVMFAKNLTSTDTVFEIPSDQRVKASALHSI